MNEGQKQLVTANLRLIPWVINRYISYDNNNPDLAYEELESIGRSALCLAALKYNGKAKFDTFAVKVIKNRLIDHVRSIQKHSSNYSFDRKKEDGYEVVDEDDASQSNIEIMELLKCVKLQYSGVTFKGIEALSYRIQGYSLNEIAVMYGVKQNSIGAWISKAVGSLRNNKSFTDALR